MTSVLTLELFLRHRFVLMVTTLLTLASVVCCWENVQLLSGWWIILTGHIFWKAPEVLLTRKENGKMAVSGEFSSGGSRDEIRTQFITREGAYRLMTLSEYSRPTRMPLNGPNNTPVRVSFVKTLDHATASNDDRLCFNVGKELYVYPYNGIRKVRLVRQYIARLYLRRIYFSTFCLH